MVKIDNLNNQTQTSEFETKTNQNQTQTNQKSGLLTIIGNLLPFAPLAFEQMTGQKVPPMTGTIAEMQMTLLNIQTNLQTIVNSQNNLVNRIQQLEVNANNQLSNLTHQFNSLRLTHTKEKKEIDFNRPLSENSEDH
jgi:hypothetical protein